MIAPAARLQKSDIALCLLFAVGSAYYCLSASGDDSIWNQAFWACVGLAHLAIALTLLLAPASNANQLFKQIATTAYIGVFAFLLPAVLSAAAMERASGFLYITIIANLMIRAPRLTAPPAEKGGADWENRIRAGLVGAAIAILIVRFLIYYSGTVGTKATITLLILAIGIGGPLVLLAWFYDRTRPKRKPNL